MNDLEMWNGMYISKLGNLKLLIINELMKRLERLRLAQIIATQNGMLIF